jgi:uncharacterized membrane protein YozB (DUF420 family)
MEIIHIAQIVAVLTGVGSVALIASAILERRRSADEHQRTIASTRLNRPAPGTTPG